MRERRSFIAISADVVMFRRLEIRAPASRCIAEAHASPDRWTSAACVASMFILCSSAARVHRIRLIGTRVLKIFLRALFFSALLLAVKCRLNDDHSNIYSLLWRYLR